MRAGVWCGAAALALLAFASALRTPQLDGVSRTARRLSAPSAPDAKLDNETEDLAFRPRISRRREEILGRERTRTRTRPTAMSEIETPQSPRNERFDSRRTYNRTRHRPTENEANIAPTVRENTSRGRSRQSSRRTPQPIPVPEVFSPRIEGTKSNLNYIADPTPKVTTFKPPTSKSDDVSNQSRRRTITTTEHSVPRRRGRINTRVDTRALDLTVSGTTNTITVSNKEPTTARISDELRNSRKLRYKTRLSETDTNLTGEGILPKIEVTQSSQPENQTTITPIIETTTSTTTEASFEPPAPTKSTKVVRRPLSRGKSNFRPTAKVKTSDEISEDDNYPASFKALIQAKNASLRSKISAQDKSSTDKVENDVKEEETNVVPEQSKVKLPEIRARTTYNPRSRKTSFSTSAPSVVSNQNSEKPVYKFNRKFRPSTTEAPKLETTSKFKRIGTSNLLKKSLARPSYYSRRNNSRTFEITSESTLSSSEKSEENSKSIPVKAILPKTSYYSRLRSKNKNNEATSNITTSTETNTEPVQTPADKKLENSLDMPLIFSLLKNSGEVDISKNASDEHNMNKKPEKEKKMFIIAVTSKESMENSTENEVTEKSQEVENKIVFNTMLPSQKYHSNFKNNDPVDVSENKDNVAHEATPPITNIQTRKRGRKRTKPDYYDDMSEVTPKTKDRSLRKYSDGYSKSTEPSTNGIPPDSDKQKGRFSSKYRGSYLDKPFYKPTVPTVTPSTPQTSTTESGGISSTQPPKGRRRLPTTTVATARRAPISRFTVTTEIPSTSTFSDEEDLQFLQNLKTVLKNNPNTEDPEAALANRIIALAVERSLNEIESGKQANEGRTGKTVVTTPFTRPITTTTTTTTTSTTARTTTVKDNTPSIEDDIKQFQEDTKLLQALIKATGQDPSQFNIPTLPSIDTTTKGARETTTQKSKLAITGQSPDEALKKLIQQTNPAGMVSEATKAPVAISTEYGKSNDALLAALLKEQGFGPTTASSLDEQVRLAALLNQVVVTPKARRTTTLPPPPPPPPRRPILDGLAWLWQQWRETAPGPPAARPNRRPSEPSSPPSSAPVNNWFGSGPFVGNADDRPSSNRVPLEPPRAVVAEQGPGRGQLVSAAINVTRAFSQFLGAAIAGAAQTVQNVIRAGQRAATDAYGTGSG